MIYLSSSQIKDLQAKAQKKFNEQYTQSVEQVGISEEFKNTPEMLELTRKHEQLKKRRKLFSKCNFLFNREVPIYSLQFLVMSFGGSFLTQEELEAKPETKYTHHVVDRPVGKKSGNIEYIQPQYIVDSLNNLYLLPTSQYGPGVALPAHLSPFVDNEKEGYIPNRQKEILHMKGEEVIVSDDEEEEEVQQKVIQSKPTKKTEEQPAGKGDADSSSDEEASESEQDVATIQAERKKANAKLKKDLEKEQKELAKVLMTNKQRKLYQKAEDEQKTKKASVQKLKAKRKIIEKKKL